MQLIPLIVAVFAALVTACDSGAPQKQNACLSKDSRTLSCHNTTVVNTCCSEYPGGLVLQTQFWGTGLGAGPKDSWTIHGLWPDFCDGTYPEFCDAAREYASPLNVLKKARKWSLIKYMEKYWTDNTGDNESLWKHEFDKHGTCMSTLETGCYGKRYVEAVEEIDFYEATIEQFKKLDSYKTLKKCGIKPSNTTTYALADVKGCLEKSFGATPFIGCTDGTISELWYYHWLRGKIVGGKYEATETTRSSSCPVTGIKYPAK